MKKVELNYVPYRTSNKGELVNEFRFTKQIHGIEIIDLSKASISIINFLTTFQLIPTNKKQNKPYRLFDDKAIYTSLNISKSTFYKSLKELQDRNYLDIKDDSYVINTHLIEKRIEEIFQSKVKSLLKDDKVYEFDSYKQQISEINKQIQEAAKKGDNNLVIELSNKIQELEENKDNSEPVQPSKDNTPEEQKEEPESRENDQLEQQFNHTSNNTIIHTVDNNNDITSNKADLEALEPIRDNNPEQEENEPETRENNNNTIKINDEMGEKLERKEAIDLLINQHCSKVYNKAALNDIRDLINRMLDYKLNNDMENFNLTRKEINRIIEKYEDTEFEDKTKDNEYANNIINNVSNVTNNNPESGTTNNTENNESGQTNNNDDITPDNFDIISFKNEILEGVNDKLYYDMLARMIDDLQKYANYDRNKFPGELKHIRKIKSEITEQTNVDLNTHDDLNNDSDNNNNSNDDNIDKGIDFDDLDMI
ncbi:MAG: hypothetical protein ACOCP8_05435 [archaeon]